MRKKIELPTEDDTLELGAKLANLVRPGAIIYLSGELGAGKTTLTRGFLRCLGFEGVVKSPTYTLVESYDLHEYQLYHFDLYRLSDAEELEYMGFADYCDKQAVVLVEWPEMGKGILPMPTLHCRLSYDQTEGRLLVIESNNPVGKAILQGL